MFKERNPVVEIGDLEAGIQVWPITSSSEEFGVEAFVLTKDEYDSYKMYGLFLENLFVEKKMWFLKQ